MRKSVKTPKIYLDNASTTPVDPAVLKAMLPYLKTEYGNPSSIHALGRKARFAIEQSRKTIADLIGAEPSEIIFTGSGTEADNLAIVGLAHSNSGKGKHIITSKIEHKAILEACKKLEKEGFEITHLDVDSGGLVSLDQLKKSLRSDTILVSIMYANNEIGTIQPIQEISDIIKHHNESLPTTNYSLPTTHCILHTDACQAVNTLPINVQELGVDAMAVSSSKIYGPKGTGFLYLNKQYSIEPIIAGGGQEKNRRSGTENVAYIVGFAKALEITERKKKAENSRLLILRGYFLSRLKSEIKGITVNGDEKFRLSSNINFSVKGAEGEALSLMLDERGIFCSTGSACSSMDLSPSYVLTSIGLPLELAHCSLRFSFGRHTTKKDLDYTIKVLKESINTIRNISSIQCS